MKKEINVFFYQGGYCSHPEFVVMKGGRARPIKFPALSALIIHPDKGSILFDTGYSKHFFNATKNFPYRLHRMITPVNITKNEPLNLQIQNQNVSVSDVTHIIISHFHADHISGLKDFDKSKFIYTKTSFESIRQKKGFPALLNGYLPDLIPDDFSNRSIILEEDHLSKKEHFLMKYFSKVYDVFGDQSILGVELPGHAKGQLGLFIETKGKTIFLIADACFLSETYKNLRFPSQLVNIISDDPKAYKDTIQRIHRLHCDYPYIEIIPSHCMETVEKYLS